MMNIRLTRNLILGASIFLAACNLPAATPQVLGEPGNTLTPFHPELATAEAEVLLEPSTASWWLSPALPSGLGDLIVLPEGAPLAASAEEAQLTIEIDQGEVISTWVYAVVAPFPTITDEVSFAALQAAWAGNGSGPFADVPLLMSAETEATFTSWWGAPAAGAVQIHAASELLNAAWSQKPAWALLPFEDIAPRWKVLAIDGQSPLWKSFDPAAYALSVPIGLSGDATLVAEALAGFGPESGAPLAPASNRDANKLTTVAITGVTALVRATAYEMERSGTTYPAEDIGPMLREADITHISNEVPFAVDCPAPDPVQRNLIFCSDASYIELLEAVGTDVVELTGDHFNDWSRDAMLYTLELYKERGWPYYGGGANIEEARQPLLLEHNGNKIAFIGCNGKGGGYASADVDYPGAGECDYEFMEGQVRDLVAQGYLVIATFQHNEVYTFIPQPTLTRDFGRISAAGATIISGSQAHQTHGMEFPRADAVIMYGLGNTFFDQRGVVDFGDRALIARHVFYDGRYISTELITIQFVDFAKPRFMTTEEREAFLTLVFDASIWDYPQE
jgi:hypothetical protein